jgi:hypothetical protein
VGRTYSLRGWIGCLCLVVARAGLGMRRHRVWGRPFLGVKCGLAIGIVRFVYLIWCLCYSQLWRCAGICGVFVYTVWHVTLHHRGTYPVGDSSYSSFTFTSRISYSDWIHLILTLQCSFSDSKLAVESDNAASSLVTN